LCHIVLQLIVFINIINFTIRFSTSSRINKNLINLYVTTNFNKFLYGIQSIEDWAAHF